jgi:hypothetical protein
MGSSVLMETAVVSALNSCAKGGLAGRAFSALAFRVVEVVEVVAVVAGDVVVVVVDVDEGIVSDELEEEEYKVRKAMSPKGSTGHSQANVII